MSNSSRMKAVRKKKREKRKEKREKRKEKSGGAAEAEKRTTRMEIFPPRPPPPTPGSALQACGHQIPGFEPSIPKHGEPILGLAGPQGP
ncbi:hypothetical protein EYF80_023874 [Liparis tanakae]|uniref:Uncharacterized protein n=1 Tax=Liparis tanakae TaxID=230148 RepID=A0A4Z2HLQ1_9TELE|nr:hypothetical protein EYF80_023874 [Liparis tanakae]